MAMIGDILSSQTFAENQFALEQMHPAQYSAFGEVNMQVGSVIIDTMHHHLKEHCLEVASFGIWTEPFGYWFHENSEDDQVGFHSKTGGVALGVDFPMGKSATFGIGGGLDHTRLNWDNNRGHADINNYFAGLYTDFEGDSAYFGASVVGGKDYFDVHRNINFSTIDRTATSNYHGYDLVGQVRGGFNFDMRSLSFSPYATWDYMMLWQKGFTENNAQSLNLDVQSNHQSGWRSELGLEIRRTYASKRSCFSPYIGLAWIYEKPISRPNYEARFINEPISYVVEVWNHIWSLFAPSVGFNITIKDRVSFSGEYRAEIGDSFFGQVGELRLSYNFGPYRRK
jgi:outer membrane autotransporter protein